MNWLSKLIGDQAARSPGAVTPAARQSASAANTPRKAAADLDALRQALAQAGDPDERQRRCVELGAALGDAMKAPLPEDAPQVWVAAICQAGDKATGLAWLERIQAGAALGEVAVHARYAEVRIAAALRIEESSVLEHVARASRHKDNGVYRHCTDVLRRRRQTGEREQRTAELAGELRALLAAAPLSVTRLLELEKALDALGGEADAAADCRDLLAQANARILQESGDRRALQAITAGSQALLAQLAAVDWPGPEQLSEWRQRIEGQLQAQAGIASWLAGQAQARASSEILQQAQLRLAAIESDWTVAQACEQFLAQAAGTEPGQDVIAAWNAMPRPGHAATATSLEARWQAMQKPVVQAPPPTAAPERAPAPPAPKVDAAAVRSHLERLEQALEQGHLAEADAAARDIKAAVGHGTLRGEIDGRLQRAQARLGELRGWAQWGAARKREDLLAAAAALLAGEHTVEHVAATVPELRELWKQLNAQAPASKEQWDSFDAALTKAYQPVARLREQEAERRAQARAVKQALCTQFEAELAAIDWQGIDFATIDARRQHMLEQWRGAPMPGFKDERLLRKRFDAMIAAIDQRVEISRGDEVHRREQLVSEAESLRELPDLRQATTRAKDLQERWRGRAGGVRLSRGDERRLWQRFRAACDAVFARRDAERTEQQAQRTRQAQAREALLDGFAAALEGADGGELKRLLGKFRADWEADKADGGEAGERLDRRARDLQARAMQRVDVLRRDQYRYRLQDLARKAASIDGLEPEVLAAGHALRQSLLIDLEIELGLPTPPDHAESRRRRQLELLQGRFRNGTAPRRDAEDLLARWHAAAATGDADLDRRLAIVVDRMVERQAASDRGRGQRSA